MTHFLAIKWAGQDNTQTLGCEIGISSDFPNRIPNPSNQIGQTRFLKSYVKVARKLLESNRKVPGTGKKPKHVINAVRRSKFR